METFPTRFGPFVLLRRLGAGGMGSAYLARHGDVDALLVVKRLHPELVRDDTIFKRFVHEAEVAAHVRHPNVAAVVAMGTVDGEPFLATEYVFGIPVSQVVDRVEQSLVDAVPLPVGLAMASELLAGLDAIHNACHRETGAPLGLIHRDIGARNVLVGFDGRVRIIDLGLGKSVLGLADRGPVLAGSPDYMAPEQAMGGRVDARADVYAAAVTIWELLAGRKRIRAESIAERVKRAVAAQPEALVSRRPDAPPRLEAILKQGMWPDPELRTPTAALLRRTLEEERRALGPRAKHEDVAAWLASSCATIIAKERRHLEDAHALERRALRPVRAETRFFVQEALERDPYAAYAADPEPEGRGGQDTGVRAALGKLAESDAAAALADLVDPERVRRGGWRARLALGAGVLAFMAVVAGVTAWILTPRPPDFQVERLPVPVVPPPPVVVPAPPPEPPPEPPEPVEPPPTAEEDPAPDEPRVATSPGIPQDLLRRRRALVERLRQLRRARFEIAFQRKLTHLSARLSSARSQRALDEIEAELKRLEAGG